ncbi:hypothetical protein X772_24945 [Mesorhizobium sp. LSJC280B00]|nr:hypothetical protein X772_24945 [Mesorhizobium sp. LSJC280B00]
MTSRLPKVRPAVKLPLPTLLQGHRPDFRLDGGLGVAASTLNRPTWK